MVDLPHLEPNGFPGGLRGALLDADIEGAGVAGERTDGDVADAPVPEWSGLAIDGVHRVDHGDDHRCGEVDGRNLRRGVVLLPQPCPVRWRADDEIPRVRDLGLRPGPRGCGPGEVWIAKRLRAQAVVQADGEGEPDSEVTHRQYRIALSRGPRGGSRLAPGRGHSPTVVSGRACLATSLVRRSSRPAPRQRVAAGRRMGSPVVSRRDGVVRPAR